MDIFFLYFLLNFAYTVGHKCFVLSTVIFDPVTNIKTVYPKCSTFRLISRTTLVLSFKQRGTLICCSFANSLSHRSHFILRVSGSSSSHVIAWSQACCNSNFPRMMNGARNPNGSNTVAVFFRTFLLVNLNSLDGEV